MIRYDTTHLDPERMAFTLAQLEGCRTVADVGSGGGKYAIEFARRGFEVTAFDWSRDLLDVVEARAEDAGVVVKTRLLDLTRLGKAPHRIPGTFDAILLFDILEHMVDDVDVLRKVAAHATRRVVLNVPTETPADLLRAGLCFPAYADTDHKRYYTEEKVNDLVKGAGLSPVLVKRINPFMPQGFVPLLFDRRDWRSRFFSMFLAGRTKSVTYRKEWNSVIAAAEPFRKKAASRRAR